MRSDCGGRRYGFKDQNTRYRKRYLDLIFNPEVPDPQSTLAPRDTARRNNTLLRALETSVAPIIARRLTALLWLALAACGGAVYAMRSFCFCRCATSSSNVRA